MFKLCKNWDHAAELLITRLSQYYTENNSAWREVLSTVRHFYGEIKANPHIRPMTANVNSLEVMIEMMSIFDYVNNGEFGVGMDWNGLLMIAF